MGQRICCVCHAYLGEDPSFQGVSHGYCSTCHAAALAEVERFEREARNQAGQTPKNEAKRK